MTTWPAPAKLNLFLHIVGRRPDGYHLLQTVFQFIDFCDTLTFVPRDDGRITRGSGPRDVPVEQDLTVRAARLLQQQAGVSAGVDIQITKRLPMGAGLGGGSSDAATTLVALNRLWRIGWETERLAALGLQLGADVPVFVRGRAAWGEGIGEVLTPLDLPEPWYLLLIPPVKVSTAAIFSAADLTRDTPPITISDFLSGRGRNDCEALVRRAYPEIDRALSWLSEHATARLTGTGSALFARFDTEAAARALLAKVPTMWQGVVAKGLNRSPLNEVLSTD
jgi:4-diphosphocytidyl-2-C-methyl-D-erythritol kinase